MHRLIIKYIGLVSDTDDCIAEEHLNLVEIRDLIEEDRSKLSAFEIEVLEVCNRKMRASHAIIGGALLLGPDFNVWRLSEHPDKDRCWWWYLDEAPWLQPDETPQSTGDTL